MDCDKTKNHSKYTNKCELKTPQLNHIKNHEWEYVYEPAEDSFLLLDALENDYDFISSIKPKVILEVGSGSGVIITALSQVCSFSHCLAIDINPHACKMTKSTSQHNQALVDVIQGDLTSCLKQSSIDMIVFNPPYVVTPSSEVNSSDFIARSWAGGVNGTEVINKFLSSFTEVMNKDSFGYILLLKENQPREIISNLKKQLFDCEIISSRKLRGEELFVLKFVKRNCK